MVLSIGCYKTARVHSIGCDMMAKSVVDGSGAFDWVLQDGKSAVDGSSAIPNANALGYYSVR